LIGTEISVQNNSDFESTAPISHLPRTDDGETTQNYSKTKRSQKSQLQECDSILSVIGKRLIESTSKQENKFDLIGKTWAYKLSEINKEQIIYAEKLINDVLYEAELGNLNRHCTLSVYPNQPYFDTSASLSFSFNHQLDIMHNLSLHSDSIFLFKNILNIFSQCRIIQVFNKVPQPILKYSNRLYITTLTN